MREILFRGKDAISKEWVYGSLIRREYLETDGRSENLGKFISYYCILTKYENDWTSREREVEVIEATIGQYTGITDKKGKKIYEGDICLCNRHIADSVDKRTFEIIFDGSWMGLSNETYGSQISYEEFDLCEVIGNIYDNHELLGGQNG